MPLDGVRILKMNTATTLVTFVDIITKQKEQNAHHGVTTVNHVKYKCIYSNNLIEKEKLKYIVTVKGFLIVNDADAIMFLVDVPAITNFRRLTIKKNVLPFHEIKAFKRSDTYLLKI